MNNYTIKLDLPSDLHIYPVLHVNLLGLAATDDPYPGHIKSLGPLIKVDGEIEYGVTAIIDSRLFGKIKKL